MSIPISPHGPVDRAQMLAVSSPLSSFQVDFKDRLDIIDTDLTDSERESERLAKKLNKRLSGGSVELSKPSEFFIDRLTKWHSNQKVEKLKTLLASHVPRVKHLEEDVVSSVATVHDQKEAVLKNAQQLLCLVDKQIDYYQHHSNFLDDVINDIRQCDFTLIREITEMKAAFAFRQELDEKPNRARPASISNPCSVLVKIGTSSSNGHVPGRRVLEDDAVVLGFTKATTPISIPGPAPGSGPGSVPGPDEPVLDCFVQLPRSLRRNSLTPGGPGSSSATTTATSCSAPMHVQEDKDGVVLQDLDTRDGADYKRKCLKSGAINLQALNLNQLQQQRSSNNSSPSSFGDIKSDCKKGSPRSFMRSVTERLGDLASTKPGSGKRVVSKSRSMSSSPAFGGPVGDAGISSSSTSSTVGGSGGESGSGKSRIFRSPSVGSVFFPPTTPTPAAGKNSPTFVSGAGTQAVTPRPSSAGASNGTPRMSSIPAIPAGHAHDPSHKVEGIGMTYEGDAPSSTPDAHGHITPSSAQSDFLASKSFSSGHLSTSSSCSNFSINSGAASGSNQDATDRRRQKYAALRNHYPTLYQCAKTHSDPGTKLLAKKLNKCLTFKDELKRSLVKAEIVQETENSCLSKMRRVQRELQDLMISEYPPSASSAVVAVSISSSLLKPSSTSGSVGVVPTSTSTESIRSVTEKDRSNSNSSSTSSLHYNSNNNNINNNSANNSSNDNNSNNDNNGGNTAVMRLFGSEDPAHDTPHSLTPTNSVLSQLVHINSDHDLSSTDDEHDHLTASASVASSSSLCGDAASHLDAVSASTTPRHTDHNGNHHTSGLIGLMERIPSDPTIIDPCQDAMVHQISTELYQTAHAVAEQLRILINEEQEASDKLIRVRHLVSAATRIDEQLLKSLSPK